MNADCKVWVAWTPWRALDGKMKRSQSELALTQEASSHLACRADKPAARSLQSQGPVALTWVTTVCRLGSPCNRRLRRLSIQLLSFQALRPAAPRRSSSKVLSRPVMWSAGIQASAARRRSCEGDQDQNKPSSQPVWKTC